MTGSSVVIWKIMIANAGYTVYIQLRLLIIIIMTLQFFSK